MGKDGREPLAKRQRIMDRSWVDESNFDWEEVLEALQTYRMGVDQRFHFIASKVAEKFSDEGTFGAATEHVEPPTNDALKKRFERLGKSIATKIVQMDSAGRAATLERLEETTRAIHEAFDRDDKERNKLDDAVKVLVDRGSKITPEQWRRVQPDQDEAFATAFSIAFLDAAQNAIPGFGPATQESVRVLVEVARTISALRYPTPAGQARDELGRGASHPSDRETNQLRPPHGGGGHDTVNRLRGGAVARAMEAVTAKGLDGPATVSRTLKAAIRTAAAATADTLATAAGAKNYKQENRPPEATAAQHEVHEVLKWLVADPAPTVTQPGNALNVRHASRGVSPPRGDLFASPPDQPNQQRHAARQTPLDTMDEAEEEQTFDATIQRVDQVAELLGA